MIQAGKYRYRIAIESYSASSNSWSTYASAWAAIDQTGASQVAEGNTPATVNMFTVRMRVQPSKTITTSMRISWTVGDVTRLLYIDGVQADKETQREELTISCQETTR